MNEERYEEFYTLRVLTNHLTFYEQNLEEHNLMNSFLCDKYKLENKENGRKNLSCLQITSFSLYQAQLIAVCEMSLSPT